MPSPTDAVERYLCTGEHDSWPQADLGRKARLGNIELLRALAAEVAARTVHATTPKPLADLDIMSFTWSKVEPMVRGLFAASEQTPVLAMLAHSVVFLTPTTVEQVLIRQRFPKTAWTLANLYLASCDAPLLASDAPQIVGLSDATTCYVSMDYFKPNNRLDDFLVHEAAHVFHNCKRVKIGLPETRRSEWLLDIAFSKRETFAYACETYSRIVALGDSLQARRELLREVEAGPMPPDDRVDRIEYVAAVHDAVKARNGWKRILAACAPPRNRATTVMFLAP